MTLIQLNDPPGFIKKGMHLLPSLGPRVVCREPKGRLSECLKELTQHLMPDPVVDARTVGQMLKCRQETRPTRTSRRAHATPSGAAPRRAAEL